MPKTLLPFFDRRVLNGFRARLERPDRFLQAGIIDKRFGKRSYGTILVDVSIQAQKQSSYIALTAFGEPTSHLSKSLQARREPRPPLLIGVFTPLSPRKSYQLAICLLARYGRRSCVRRAHCCLKTSCVSFCRDVLLQAL